MKKTNFRILWGIGIVAVIGVSVGLTVALVQARRLIDVYSQLLQLAAECDAIAAEVSNGGSFIFLQALLILNAIAMLFSQMIVLTIATVQQHRQYTEHEQQLGEVRREHDRQLAQARRLGREEGLRTIAQGLVADEDVLAELTTWLQKYHKGEATLVDSARIHSRILELLVRQARLMPISKVDDIVAFDPRMHTTYDRLRPGDKAVVVEPGWKFAQDILKLPIVRRRP